LTARPLERALPRIAERIVAEGGRALVVAADAGRREALDRLLWTYAPASFLPHGQAGVMTMASSRC
jgi:DNA polymerase-3 subunit chi